MFCSFVFVSIPLEKYPNCNHVMTNGKAVQSCSLKMEPRPTWTKYFDRVLERKTFKKDGAEKCFFSRCICVHFRKFRGFYVRKRNVSPPKFSREQECTKKKKVRKFFNEYLFLRSYLYVYFFRKRIDLRLRPVNCEV